MNLHVMSDLHLEHRRLNENTDFFEELAAKKLGDSLPDEVEVAVLAGDITSMANAYIDRTWSHFKKFSSIYKHIVYIPGNHEYYDSSFPEVTKVLTTLQEKFPNVHVLDKNTTFTHNGVKFVGDTLWFPDPPWNANKRGLADYSLIRFFQPEVYERNKSFEDKVVPNITKDCVVVTHHLPFPKSTHAKYAGDPFNAFFLSDCSKFVSDDNAPKLWIHGHTHDPCDYKLPIGTRVYCNPRGYPREGLNEEFFNSILVKI